MIVFGRIIGTSLCSLVGSYLSFVRTSVFCPDPPKLHILRHISYENRQISSIHSTKFGGLVIDYNLSRHCRIDQMIPKPKKASYAIRSLKPLLSFESLKMVYFSTVHSIRSYGIIFWGISTHNKIIFKIQK